MLDTLQIIFVLIMSYHLNLTKQGYMVHKDLIDASVMKEIKKELTVKPIVLAAYQDFSKPNPFEIYQESPNYLYLPRFYGIEKFGPPLKTRFPTSKSIDVKMTHDILPHQKIAYEKSIKQLKEVGGGVLSIPCGGGKCLSINTPILMFDGSIKKVQDVVVGDLLMGDDSTPRKVLSLARGKEEMFEIHPLKGEKWACNKSHILSLKCSTNHSNRFKKGTVHDIELSEFLNLPKVFHGKASPLRQYKVGVKFEAKSVSLDPYLLGYWLGDGYSKDSQISTENMEVVEFFKMSLQEHNLSLKEGNTTEYHKGYMQYKITTEQYDANMKTWSQNDCRNNYFHQCLIKYNLLGNKHIPMDYKCNSRKVQLAILAGLIDSDGYFSKNCYYFTLVNENLLDDIIYMCRSLGFAAYKSVVQKTCTNLTSKEVLAVNPDDKFGRVSGTYYSCTISGNGLEEIPVLLNCKKAKPSKQIKDPLVTGFKIHPLGMGDYYGFVIDGNHRFLLGDFTVTHNTFLSIKLATEIAGKTLVVVNKECLMDQWIESIRKFTGGKARIGIIQQNKIDVEEKDFVVAMLHSLCKKDYPKEIFDGFKMAIYDETHHLGSEMFSKALSKAACEITLGLSATPIRKDGLSKVFYHYIGPLFHTEKRQGNNSVLVKKIKLSSPTSYYETLYMSNGIKNTGAMVTNLSRYETRSQLIVECITALMKQDRKILLLSGRREHLEQIHQILQYSDIRNIHGKKISFGYYYGNQGMNKQQHKKMLLQSALCDIVLGTYSIASEGLDIPDLNTLIFATPASDVEQAVGRILRKYHEKINPIVIDLIDKTGNFPKQGKTRSKLYMDENYEMQELNIPLGHHVNDLQPFLMEIKNYLYDTEVKQSKLKFTKNMKGKMMMICNSDESDSDNSEDEKINVIGECLLNENENENENENTNIQQPIKITLKKISIKKLEETKKKNETILGNELLHTNKDGYFDQNSATKDTVFKVCDNKSIDISCENNKLTDVSFVHKKSAHEAFKNKQSIDISLQNKELIDETSKNKKSKDDTSKNKKSKDDTSKNKKSIDSTSQKNVSKDETLTDKKSIDSTSQKNESKDETLTNKKSKKQSVKDDSGVVGKISKNKNEIYFDSRITKYTKINIGKCLFDDEC